MKIQTKRNKSKVKTEASLGFCLCWSESSLSAGVKHVSRCYMAVLIKCWALSILSIVPCFGLEICFITTVAGISNQCALLINLYPANIFCFRKCCLLIMSSAIPMHFRLILS